MSESKFEEISSLVDNYQATDQESEQAIDEILKDEHLSTTWRNYHLIGDVMRDEVASELPLDLSAKIADALQDKPTVLAPNRDENKAANPFKAKVIQLVKPLGQLAIAASAAGLMIIGVQQNVADNNEVITPNKIVQTKPLAGFANPVSFNYQQPVQPQKKAVLERRIEQQRRFQALLSDHQQQIKLSAEKINENSNLESQPANQVGNQLGNKLNSQLAKEIIN
mgnify:FL=1